MESSIWAEFIKWAPPLAANLAVVFMFLKFLQEMRTDERHARQQDAKLIADILAQAEKKIDVIDGKVSNLETYITTSVEAMGKVIYGRRAADRPATEKTPTQRRQ